VVSALHFALLNNITLDQFFFDDSIDTIISAKNDTHLTWRKDGERFVPNYEKRLNRQELPQVYRETGGFLITRPRFVTRGGRIGERVQLALLSPMESIDIDDYTDWALCEFFLRRKRILFVVAGNRAIGLGHAYNTMTIAGDIMNHELQFLVTSGSELARDRIASHNYPVVMQRDGIDLVDEIASLKPDLVVNDVLDTTAEYVRRIKAQGITVVNFEDLGDGAAEADLVINAIYPESEKLPRHYFGQDYFLLRDEFLIGADRGESTEVKNVLVTFGGVDPSNLTRKVLSAISRHCAAAGIAINVVAGFGYDRLADLEGFDGVTIHRDVKNISDHMAAADVVFTSAGRTVYEVASVGRPGIILAQNERELLHFFASKEHGFKNLGLGAGVPEETILETFIALAGDAALRRDMAARMRRTDFGANRRRVVDLITRLLEK